MKIILSRLPVSYKTWRQLGIFRHGKMDKINYLNNVFDFHVNRSGLSGNLNGKIILELGPGDSVASALLAACHGARCILLDAGVFASEDISIYHQLAIKLRAAGMNLPTSFMDTKTLNEVIEACNATYYTDGTISFNRIDSDSVDLIFSQAVLEHISLNEFNQFIAETYRVLKLGGVSSHQIDLKDHLGGALNNLRFSEKIWESSFFSKSGFYTNRLGYTDIVNVFKKEFSDFYITGIDKWDQPPIHPDSLAECFKSRSVEDLSVKQFDIIAKK